MVMKWNSRFEAYAAAQGRTPKGQLEYDREVWPGGCMCGFICWIAEQIRAYVKECPKEACCVRCAGGRKGFTLFLRSLSKKS